MVMLHPYAQQPQPQPQPPQPQPMADSEKPECRQQLDKRGLFGGAIGAVGLLPRRTK